MKKLFLTLAAFALVSSPALAGDHEHGDHDGKKHSYMEKVDTDGDGAISKAEFLASKEARFDKMDADSDGLITKDEMKAYKSSMKEKYKKFKDKKRGEYTPKTDNETDE